MYCKILFDFTLILPYILTYLLFSVLIQLDERSKGLNWVAFAWIPNYDDALLRGQCAALPWRPNNLNPRSRSHRARSTPQVWSSRMHRHPPWSTAPSTVQPVQDGGVRAAERATLRAIMRRSVAIFVTSSRCTRPTGRRLTQRRPPPRARPSDQYVSDSDSE